MPRNHVPPDEDGDEVPFCFNEAEARASESLVRMIERGVEFWVLQ